MIFHCLVVKMRIGNFANIKMRNHYNRRTRFAWLLLMVYLPMLLALVLALTLVTNIIVQVLKSLLYGGGRGFCRCLLFRLQPPCPPRRPPRHQPGLHPRVSDLPFAKSALRGAYHCSYSSICCYGLCRLFHVLPLCQDAPRRYPIYPCSASSPYFVVFRIFDPNLLAITILRGRLGTYPFHVL